ncbi:MAG: TonB-dependent receptor [Cyclobacteriaceae bacterium]
MKKIITILFLLPAISASSQNCIQFSGNFDNTWMEEVLGEMKSSTGMDVYYNEAWIDTMFVSKSFQNTCVKDVIDQLFAGTSLSAIIYDGKIIVTYDSPIIRIENSFVHDTIAAESTDTNLVGFLFKKDLESSGEESVNEVLEVGNKSNFRPGTNVEISGYVKEKETGEPLVGALVFIDTPPTSTITNLFGYYSIKLPSGRNNLKIRFSGMKNIERQVVAYSAGALDFEMEDKIIPLKEIVISSDRDDNIQGVEMGLTKIDLKSIKNVPKILGENDLVKVALTLPGVKSVGEGAQGFNVRGGFADQNLIMLNNATIYNSSHFFGFFSIFNADVIKESQLYKSSIPATLGGRLSSVMEVTSRDGNQNQVSGKGGISPISARLSLDVPIIRDKLSVVLGGRSTYSDWILDKVKDDKIRNSQASFNDFNFRIKSNIDQKSRIYLSGYFSNDDFNLLSDSLFSYSNKLLSAEYVREINQELNVMAIATSSNYNYNIEYDENPVEGFDIGFRVNETSLKTNFDHLVNEQHSLNYGFEAKFYKVNPGERNPFGAESLVVNKKIDEEKGTEFSLFISDQFDVTRDLSVQAGLRYSSFGVRGNGESYVYEPGVAKDITSIVDTVQNSGGVSKFYHGPELRLSAKYSLNSTTSIKTSYNRSRQYINLLSNTTSVSPIDIWKLSDEHIEPQVADQVSLGIYKNLAGGVIETSLEGYYKKMQNLLDYKIGSQLILNEIIEADVLQGEGKSYGLEFLARKKQGKLNGWFSYSYSRSFLKIDGANAIENVNNGEFFPTNFDKPHDMTLVSNYKFNRRISFSFNTKYSTGRPITFPVAQYEIGGQRIIQYSDRNQFRIPDYFRIDFGVNIEGNHKSNKPFHSFWSFSVYNLLGRNNAYSVFFEAQENEVKAYKLSVFGDPVPTITYNFSF